MLARLKRLISLRSEEFWTRLCNKAKRPYLRVMSNQGLISPLPRDLASLLEEEFPLRQRARSTGVGADPTEESVLEFFLKRRDFLFYSFADAKEQILALLDQNSPLWRQDAVQAADRICEPQFNFFQAGDFCFADGIDWHQDITTGRRWPVTFSPDIPYRGPEKVGDIKYPWELNRHQYFTLLGKAYWASDDEKYAREFFSQVESWIEANPYLRGINWISPLESAVRIISWLWGFYFFKDSPQFSARFLSVFLRSIWRQLSFIEQHLSRGFYENNHLIGEAAGLFIGGLFLQGFKKARAWADLGKSILLEQIVKQTHPDGVNVEQAAHYQRFSMDFFVLFKILYNQNVGQLPAVADERLEKMFDFLMHVMKPDGTEPDYGDCDNARGIPFCEGECSNCRPFLATGAVLFCRGDMKWAARGMGEEVIWLLGEEGCRIFNELSPQIPAQCSRLFPEGGYYVARDNWGEEANYLLFDCGPLGYGPGAHGHADALSIQVVAFGQEAIVDPGTYAYNQDQKFRNYFRSTRAHNTVSVDGLDQSRIIDRMAWESIPQSEVKDCFFSELFDIVSAENDGYTRLASPVIHRRTVIFFKKPVYYLVIDQLQATGPHTYGLHFHFPPETTLQQEGKSFTAIFPGKQWVFLRIVGAEDCHPVVQEGDPSPMGWYSRMYGHKVSSPSLSFLSQASGSMFFYSLIMPSKGGQQLQAALEARTEHSATILVVRHDESQDTWFVAHERPAEMVSGDILFCGKTGFIRRRSRASQVVVAYGRQATRLQIAGRSFFEAVSPKEGYLVNKTI